jgi:hypothetical protein
MQQRPEPVAGAPGRPPADLPLPHRSDTPLLSEEQQIAFFDAAMARCAEAERRVGTVVRHLDVAGTRIALSFAGRQLIPSLLPALAHLEVPADRAADVTFHLWDTRSTGIEAPPPPCGRECFTDRGDIWGLASRRIRSAFHWIEYSLNLLDLDRRAGMFWVRSDERMPYWTKASPLRSLLHWWMEANGAQLLHAAAVGDDDGALLITGKGGSGKSTTALTCLTSGLRYIADDYLVVRLDPEPTVCSLYSTAKLDQGQMARFPGLVPFVTNAGEADDKAVVHLHPAFGGQLRRTLPLKGIAMPRFTGGSDTTFTPASPILLQRAAAFTTMSQLPHAGRTTHEFIDRMVGTLPGFTMELGTDLTKVASAVRDLVQCSDDTLRSMAASDRVTPPAARPLVSVIVPVYEGAAFLPDAIRNIVSQEYPALEIIVVDDGSTQDIAAALRPLPVDVRLFRQDNAGAAAARNRGIRDASGEFIAFLDVDDLWPECNLDVLVERLLAHPDADVVRGRAQLTTYAGAPEPGEFLGNPAEAFPHYIGAGLYRRRAFEKVGLFDPDLRFGEDTDWYTRGSRLVIHQLEEVTLYAPPRRNMTRGKSLVELNQLRLFKKTLDRRRSQVSAVRRRRSNGTVRVAKVQ